MVLPPYPCPEAYATRGHIVQLSPRQYAESLPECLMAAACGRGRPLLEPDQGTPDVCGKKFPDSTGLSGKISTY
jgi:hypothetical protein